MNDEIVAAASALLAAARVDRSDHGRTSLVPRVCLERLKTALEREGQNARPGPEKPADGENGENR